MRWRNARRSQNIEDHRGRRTPRGRGGRTAVGGGIGGIIIALIAIFVFNVDPQTVLDQAAGGGGLSAQVGDSNEPYQPQSAEEEEMADFTSAVLGYTEDVWDKLYPGLAQAQTGRAERYVQPKLRLFTDSTRSACGDASASIGPFYCPADSRVYLDLSFFDQLRRDFNAPGDFAQAYVIAHEVGHHIQNLLGISGAVQQQRQRVSKEQGNQLSVRLELQADYFAGVWARHGQEKFNFLQEEDVEEAIGAAKGVGDDMIQKRSQGYVVPEAFTHGSAEQRVRWFMLGFKSGDPTKYNTFEVRYDQL